ncbi:MAG: FAD:protein FMN transferase [Rhodoferax sp.]|jgi:thiamine biosynthesis lipoprotein|nr:FAD:protein FMN transferase [Rhodoferax sp.]
MKRWCALRFDFRAMASPCSIQMDGQDEHTMRQAATEAIGEVQRIEHKYSRYREDSIVSRINQSSTTGGQVAVDGETTELLGFAHALWLMSDGLFDITSGVLRQAWDFRAARLPEPAKLQSTLEKVGWNKVERSGSTVRLTQPGMELDFGGFGKEYAADRAAAVLHRHGIAHALVNLGGDLHALGARALPELQDTAWQIEIQHPRPDTAIGKSSLAVLALQQGGLATSGDYERFFIQNGKRYCHVLNPHTGWPVTHWQSVSVLAANTTTAGALTTIAMLKQTDALDWLSTQGVRYLAVQHDGQVHSSSQSL